MTSRYLVPVVLLAAMMLGVRGQEPPAGSLSQEEVDTQCQGDSGAVFAHQGECQLFYNCSVQGSGPFDHYGFPSQVRECPYPQLFSQASSSCQPFEQVTCGQRQELVDHCDYLTERYRHGYRGPPCSVYKPSCKGLEDGVNVYEDRLWSPYYVICRSQRTIHTGLCPGDTDLSMPRFPHPEKHRCVVLYEVPTQYPLSCTGKADGPHMDDVTGRPDVFYNCQCGQLGGVQKCPQGEYFDELLKACSASPLRNSIMGLDKV